MEAIPSRFYSNQRANDESINNNCKSTRCSINGFTLTMSRIGRLKKLPIPILFLFTSGGLLGL